MVINNCYRIRPNRSEFFRKLREYFRGRGITSDRKIEKLVWRWVRRKGYRLPQNA